MSFKKQVDVIKKNWLFLLVIVLVVLVLPGFSGQKIASLQRAVSDVTVGSMASEGYYPGGGIAPDVDDRIKTLSSYLSVEINRGDFDLVDSAIKGKVDEIDGLLMNENVYVNGEGVNSRKIGNYNIRIPLSVYDFFVEDLKDFGDVVSFSEQTDDITGSSTNLAIELAAEEKRLVLYNSLLSSADEDKIELVDKIFDQERRIAYLKERIKTQGERVDYVNLQLTVEENECLCSGFVITFKSLISSFLQSLSSLIRLIIVLIPYALAFWLIKFLWKKFK